ncbi:hypothetical protein PoB_006825100 [Plakobranchus ocellatus]|uniref:Uncharacterized protein n=1 Tax=Plakobranchus ocellatus TaxID=259542 RepID=A0AAV4DCV0_9GAST|nr:hypothetical protein PoB_006825100 [Plakobranchus ocellatus]
MSSAVQPQLAALSQMPQITTYKAVNKSQQPPLARSPSSSSSSSSIVALQAEPVIPLPQHANSHSNHLSNSDIYQQQPLNRVPFKPSLSSAVDSSLFQPTSASSQSVTAKAFSSAQAIFSKSSSVPSSHQTTSSAYQGRSVPFASFGSSDHQGWANGQGDERAHVRRPELASLKNIRSLSGQAAEPESDSDSPLSRASSLSIGSLANPGQGRPTSRSMGSTVSLVSPPPPSPSSVIASGSTNGINGSALAHATSDHPFFPPVVAELATFPEPINFSLPSRPLSPPYDNMSSPLVEVPVCAASDTTDSYVDTTSTPFLTALASFSKTTAPCSKPSASLGATQGSLLVEKQAGRLGNVAADSDKIHKSSKYQISLPFKVSPESHSSPLQDFSTPFRRGSDSLVYTSSSSVSEPKPYEHQSKFSATRLSAERGGSLSVSPATPSPQHFVRLHEYISSSPPAQRRSLPPPPAATESTKGGRDLVATHRNSLPAACEATNGNAVSKPSQGHRQSYLSHPSSNSEVSMDKDGGSAFAFPHIKGLGQTRGPAFSKVAHSAFSPPTARPEVVYPSEKSFLPVSPDYFHSPSSSSSPALILRDPGERTPLGYGLQGRETRADRFSSGARGGADLDSHLLSGIERAEMAAGTNETKVGKSDRHVACNTVEGVSKVAAITSGAGVGKAGPSTTNESPVQEVWSPPATAVPPPFPVTAGVTSVAPGTASSPATDPELKKAYFRQLEEIRALQEQVQLKDRRIAQLEAELSAVRDRDADLKPGESNC